MKIDVVALRSGVFNADFMGVCQFSIVVKKVRKRWVVVCFSK